MPSVPDGTLAADQWIPEDQWLAGFPGDHGDRCGWLWWSGSGTAVAQSLSHW